ncbi:Acetylcholinesterase [Dactylella cylindrospora]|nr:Acetylcholinesterase [Dactylella cylindrospora]
MQHLLYSILFASVAFARPSCPHGATKNDPPILHLPWGDYSATIPEETPDVAIYRDVRFGRPPVGDLRFRASQFPDKPYDDSNPVNCIGVNLAKLADPECNVKLGLGKGTPFTSLPDPQGEDCLFLDVYVPADLEKYKEPLPVIVLIYGGAYIFGSKSSSPTQGMLYSGVGPIRNAALHGNGVIFVVGNYRTGAFGWLAGEYMEENGTPNAGLSDQRLLLEWVQQHISKLGGDPENVSVWGESAGAGSIVHHLVSYGEDGEIRDPLFKNALIQSPAYQWMWDRSGKLNDAYYEFATLAGCHDGDIGCLRRASPEDLTNANQDLSCKYHKGGLFPFGPAIDGKVIKDLPVYALGRDGHYWPMLNSVISSHVNREADMFTEPLKIETAKDFDDFIRTVFPDDPAYSAIVTDPLYLQDFPSQKERLTQVVKDSMFISNSRALYEAYKGRTFMLNYEYPLPNKATHGADLIPTFYYDGINITALLETFKMNGPGMEYLFKTFLPPVAEILQQYFVSHAVTGDPSRFKDSRVVDWPTPRDGDVLESGVMRVVMNQLDLRARRAFRTDQPDKSTSFEVYSFWQFIADSITEKLQTSCKAKMDYHEDIGLGGARKGQRVIGI